MSVLIACTPPKERGFRLLSVNTTRTAVVETVAFVANCEVSDLALLYGVIDPEALNTIVTPLIATHATTSISVSFVYVDPEVLDTVFVSLIVLQVQTPITISFVFARYSVRTQSGGEVRVRRVRQVSRDVP